MKLKKTSEWIISDLYQLVFDLSEILTQNGIGYWLIAGTALGAVRHKGIIPWDDDIDIGIDREDSKRLWSLEREFRKYGIGLSRHWLGTKVYYLDSKDVKGRKHKFPNIDIFYMKIGKTKVKYSSNLARYYWPKEYFYTDELFPLRLYKFGETYLYGAKKYKPYLDRSYKKWNTIAYREFDHERLETVEKVKIRLTKRDRVPAKPFRINKNRIKKYKK